MKNFRDYVVILVCSFCVGWTFGSILEYLLVTSHYTVSYVEDNNVRNIQYEDITLNSLKYELAKDNIVNYVIYKKVN